MAPPQPSPVRPNGAIPQNMPRPMMGPGMSPYGMVPGLQGPPQYPMMGGYQPQPGFYPGYNPYEQQNFAGHPQHWAPPQHPQYAGGYAARPPMSPRSAQNQLSATQSPLPPSASLPSSAAPTPPSRPASLMNGHHHTPSNASISSIPSTPSRPMGNPATASPYSHLSGGASSFTPRRSAAIKISRPDGSTLDIAEAAKASKKTPETSGTTSPAPAGETAAEAKEEAPKKKMPALPVIVRIESEEQKKVRLAEEAEREKKRELEKKEEEERKERQEKRAKEEEERKAKDAADQAEREKAEAEAKAKAEAEAEQKTADEAAAPAPEKLAEQRRSLITPTTSATASPLGSPAPGAGLPAKPVAAINSAKPVPAALDLTSSSPIATGESSTASPSALNSARPIDDINSIVYPESLKSPHASLNVDAEPGKFRYDREFLMQFMSVCKEKPESLPPLEEIGLEADTSSGFGSRGPRGGRSSQSGSSRSGAGASTGLGIGGISRSSMGMGSFGMGQFGSGSGSLRGTSEQRYRASMARTPSQGGPAGLPGMSGLPMMGQSTSRSGASRGSQRGAKRAPQEPRASTGPAPVMVVSENAWTRGRLGGDAEGTPVFIERKVKALLNKLTEEKFDAISKQILEWANKSEKESDGLTLKLVIKLIFEKATDEAHWSAMYAKLCRLILTELNPVVTEVIDGKPVSGGALFRKYLLGRCQMDFEAGWKAREATATAAAAKQEEDKERLAKHEESKEEGGAENSEAAMLSDEYYAAQKAKRRGLGLVQLIGELYKMEMVSKTVIRACFSKLLGISNTGAFDPNDPDEEDIESACRLMTTIGGRYDQADKHAAEVNKVFERLEQISKGEDLASRIKFMIMDVIDLRKNGWQSRNKQAGVMTIAEIHQQAAQDKAASAAHAAQSSISRGGSRAGRDRRDAPQPGEWQAVSSNPRALNNRNADFSGMGRNISSTGAQPSFGGPTSVFASRKGKAGSPSTVTPPLSRQQSSANMFSALNDAHEASETSAGASADAAEPAPQRKRLALAPRTKPLPGDDSKDEAGDAEEEKEEDAEEESDEMSEEAAKVKIDSDMKELWGEKDQGGSRNPGDVADYFAALPEARRPLLAARLLDDVFRISKLKEAEIVAKGWKKALEAGASSTEQLKEALEARMPTLDDDAIDFPVAYKAIGLLIRSLSLSAEDVEALGDKIDVEGTPRVTPKQKLEKALALLDEEAASA
ncbi:hypothetical protein IAT38_002941 [Cryptococcus sp. DSM 104549]